jgi:DNA polymerase-3 subunit delta
MALERLDGEEADYERIRESIESLPFLTARKLVVLREPSKQKNFAEKIDELLGAVAETTEIVIVEPKLDKRLSYYKTLKKRTEFREFGELDNNDLIKWAVGYAKDQEATLNSNDARFLIERVGDNQQLLKNELDKLLLFNPKISRETIEVMTELVPQSTIFELLDAAFVGDKRRALKIYNEQRMLKVEPQQIISMLAWQLHVMALIKTAGERTPDQIARETKLNPFVIRKSLNIARRLTLIDLKKQVNNLLTIDTRLKNESIDADEALQFFLLTLSE